MNLHEAPPGMHVVNKIMSDSGKYIRRMVHLGIMPGVEIIKCPESKKNGPVLLVIKGSTLVIGRGIASRILVNGMEKKT